MAGDGLKTNLIDRGMALHTPINNVSVTVSATHTSGGLLLVSDGSVFGSPTVDNPVRITVFRAGVPLTILSVTNVSSNILTIGGALEGYSDVTLVAGDVVRVLVTAGTISDIHSAINAIPTLVAGSNISLTPGTGTVTIAATGGGGGGGVSSVALSMPGGLTVSGSPITTSGTLAVTTTLSGMLKSDNASGSYAFKVATAGTDYVSPSGLSTTLGGYVDKTSTQTITGTKTFGQTQIFTTGATDKVTSSNAELVIEQTGDSLGTTRFRLQGRAGLTGALFECATGYDVIDFGFKSGSYTRSLRAEYRSGDTYSGGPEFTMGDNSDGVHAYSTFFTGDNFSGFFGSLVIVPKSGLAFSLSTPVVGLDVRSGISLPFRVTSTDTTLTGDDYEIMVSGNSTAVTITLPAIGSAGVRFVVSDVAGTAATYNITIVVTGGHYLNASTSAVINTNYKQLHFVCTGIGSNYYYAP